MKLKMSCTKWQPLCLFLQMIIRGGRVTHICISKLTSIGSDNGLSPGWRQDIFWTKAGILLIWTNLNKLRWNLNCNAYIFIQENAFENVVWKMAAILSLPSSVNADHCHLTVSWQYSGWRVETGLTANLVQQLGIAKLYFSGLVQERRNSSALAMELHLSCTNPSIW